MRSEQSAQIDPKLLIRTCIACPSQWEGPATDGRYVYIRFRHDSLTVYISDEESNNVDDALNGERIVELTSVVGDGEAGYMTDNELNRILTGLNLSADPEFLSEEKAMLFTLDGAENVTTVIKRKNDKSS